MINPVIEEDLQYILSSELPWESFWQDNLNFRCKWIIAIIPCRNSFVSEFKKLGPPVKIVGIVRNKEKPEIVSGVTKTEMI